MTNKHQCFAKQQEAVRKDIERSFEVLKSRFAIMSIPCRDWCRSFLAIIVRTCFILHNMALVHENSTGIAPDFLPNRANGSLTQVQRLLGEVSLRDSEAHMSLRDDLVEHLFPLYHEGEIE